MSVENIEISLYTLSSRVASTLNPRQFSQSLEISKQFLRGIKQAISRKLATTSTAGYLLKLDLLTEV